MALQASSAWAPFLISLSRYTQMRDKPLRTERYATRADTLCIIERESVVDEPNA